MTSSFIALRPMNGRPAGSPTQNLLLTPGVVREHLPSIAIRTRKQSAQRATATSMATPTASAISMILRTVSPKILFAMGSRDGRSSACPGREPHGSVHGGLAIREGHRCGVEYGRVFPRDEAADGNCSRRNVCCGIDVGSPARQGNAHFLRGKSIAASHCEWESSAGEHAELLKSTRMNTGR